MLKEIYTKNLSVNILFLRKRNKMTQDALAERLDIQTPNIGYYESGKTVPNLENLVKIAFIFKVSTDALLFTEISKADSSTVNEPETPYYTLPNAQEIMKELEVTKKHFSKIEGMLQILKERK